MAILLYVADGGDLDITASDRISNNQRVVHQVAERCIVRQVNRDNARLQESLIQR